MQDELAPPAPLPVAGSWVEGGAGSWSWEEDLMAGGRARPTLRTASSEPNLRVSSGVPPEVVLRRRRDARIARDIATAGEAVSVALESSLHRVRDHVHAIGSARVTAKAVVSTAGGVVVPTPASKEATAEEGAGGTPKRVGRALIAPCQRQAL
ncbi:hypothetical protein T484DRAFT_1807050 [Baffinella frigidus]|nr:hypothetical protein T484DRAFT_1807050 [Cryptophyta sp. CCMP2293]